MRRYFTFLLFMIISVFSDCKKDNSGLQGIIGSWEARISGGGITGIKYQYPAGNGMIIKFSESGIERYSNGKLTYSGIYTIVKDVNDITKQPANRIIFDNQTDNAKIFIEIVDNYLTLSLTIPDGGYSTYEKVE